MSLLDTTVELAKFAGKLANPELVQMAMKANIEALEVSQANLELQKRVAGLGEQLKQAEAKLKLTGEVIRVGQAVYYKDGDDQHPCCLRCFDIDRRMVHIVVVDTGKRMAGQSMCPQCKTAHVFNPALRDAALEKERARLQKSVGN